MSIDPRLMERRKTVAEDHAKRNVRRLLRLIVLAILIAAVAWLALSPWLSVNQVRTAGIVTSDANAILASHRVIAGTPMILLRPDSVEQALEADPWVREARVHLDWPDEVIVRVEERVPVAWVETGYGWTRRDREGVSVPSEEAPDDTYPWIRLPDIPETEAAQSQLVQGAVEFAAALPPSAQAGTTIRLSQEELWATVTGFEVRLGRPVEMTAKALSLRALLEEPIAEGSTLILVAPSHPAVQPPRVEEGESDPEGWQSLTIY